MFRELERKHKQLPMEDCIHVLKTEKRGVLSVNGDGGYPYAMPMNHYYNEADGKLYFHCGKSGHRLDALRRDSRACFCTHDEGYAKPGEWALNVKSVIVFGQIEIVDDLAQIAEITTALSYKFIDDEAHIRAEIEQYAHKTLLLVLTPEHICGKLVEES